MKGLIKYLKFFLVSSLLLIISCKQEKAVLVVDEDIKTEMTKEDSIRQLASDLNIQYSDTSNIHVILNLIIKEKQQLINRLDSLDERADEMESMAYEFKRREDRKLRDELLAEINKVKTELQRIKNLTPDEIVKKDTFAIPEEKITEKTTTFEDLPPGNYITRIDKYHLISIYVKEDGEIIFSQPRLDSTTVLKGGKKLSPRVKKELDQIRNRINDR